MARKARKDVKSVTTLFLIAILLIGGWSRDIHRAELFSSTNDEPLL